ncbi:MAG: hypothetical protein V4719_24100 [Planctomycetota bacterium]
MVTFSVSVYRRRRLLNFDRPKRIVLRILKDLLDPTQGKGMGFGLLPDHVHVLAWPALPDPLDLRRVIPAWKQISRIATSK